MGDLFIHQELVLLGIMANARKQRSKIYKLGLQHMIKMMNGYQVNGEMKSKLYQITAPHFVAGFLVENNLITKAAPIISYAKRMAPAKFLAYCDTKGWEVTIIIETYKREG